MKKISLAIIFTLLSTSFLASADELNKVNVNPEYNFYTGVFEDAAGYVYTGVQANYKIGNWNFNPSFAPGYYNEGDGKDLGHALEFKSEIQLSLDLPKESQIGFSYNHLSNASLGDKNPGANSYMFNLFKKF